MRLLPAFALLLALFGCQPPCPPVDGMVRQQPSLTRGPEPIAAMIDTAYLTVTYSGCACDTTYLGYAVEVRTLPPQYYLSIQGPDCGVRVTRRFDVRRFAAGSVFYFGPFTLTKPSRGKAS